jgi:hypothetical protein
MKSHARNAELLAKLTIVPFITTSLAMPLRTVKITCTPSIDALFPWSVHTGIAALLLLLDGVFPITCFSEKLLKEILPSQTMHDNSLEWKMKEDCETSNEGIHVLKNACCMNCGRKPEGIEDQLY